MGFAKRDGNPVVHINLVAPARRDTYRKRDGKRAVTRLITSLALRFLNQNAHKMAVLIHEIDICTPNLERLGNPILVTKVKLVSSFSRYSW